MAKRSTSFGGPIHDVDRDNLPTRSNDEAHDDDGGERVAPEAETKSYLIVADKTIIDGVIHAPGDRVELTEEQAEVLRKGGIGLTDDF